MPFPLLIPLIMAGASYIGGRMGNKNKSSSTQTQTSSTTPTWDSQFSGLRDTILPITMKRLTDPQSFSKQLSERGITDINRTYDLAEQGMANSLTARGLGSSPIAASGIGKMAGGRAGDIVSLLRDMPMIERQMQDQDMNFGSNLLSMGRGNQLTGNSSSTGELTQGGGNAGGLQSMMSMLAYLYGNGAFGGGAGGGAPLTNNMTPPWSSYPSAPPMNRPY